MSRIEEARLLNKGELLEEIVAEVKRDLFDQFCTDVDDTTAAAIRASYVALDLIIMRIRSLAGQAVQNKEVRDDNGQ